MPHPLSASTIGSRSLAALGRSTIDVYYLHTPSNFSERQFARAISNLRTLQADGKIKHIGLSNVSYDQLIAAQAGVTIAAVQNRCNIFAPGSFDDGVVGQCKTSGAAFVPHSPVGGRGGHQAVAARDELRAPSVRLGCSPHEVMLSWLLQIDDCIVPVVGASKLETVRSIARTATSAYQLHDAEIVALFEAGRKLP